MKSIQTRIIIVISAIMIVVVASFLFTSTIRTNVILDNDSEQILLSAADYYANVMDDTFRSTEQSVHTIYNYALKRTEAYPHFLEDQDERDQYINDVSELSKSIAESTPGAMAVYLRFNPEDFGSVNGLWYTIDLENGTWQSSVPTDIALYDRNDIEHVGWYFIPIETGEPMWMDPYYNANLEVDMISYIIPYYHGDYTVGIIGMDISMELLKEAVSDVSVYDSGRAFLLARNGDLIYHENHPDGIPFSELSSGDQAYFRTLLETDKDKAHVFPGLNGTSQKLILKELRNGMILGVYAPLSEISAPQRILLGQQLAISLIILFLAILVCLVWVRTITNPLKRMTAVAMQYASGNFDEKMSEKGEDEVGILSRSLQTMSTSLKQQIEIADSANKAKSDFLANMSHEIRTPINAVLGMNEMILRETREENIRSYSADIQTAGRTLLSIINSILDFSKIEDGKMEILPVSYDLATLINNLVNSISERARAKGLKFEVHIDESLPAVLRGDDVRLTQIIMNLLTNAVKYTEKGTVTLSVRDGGRKNDDIDLEVEVRDTGIGIRQADLEKLAMSFTRVDEKRNRNIEGTGLGMAIVTKLLEMMGSELKLDSVYGEGTTFSFRLRQQIVDMHPIGDYEERVREMQRREMGGSYPQIKDAKILVVDDYEMNLKVAVNLLKIFGIEPDLASSGREAIEMIRRKHYHMVLLDHMMPQMDGIETLRELRSAGLIGRGTAMVALTANAVVGARETYLSAGFDDYLSKPIEVEALGELLFEHLPVDLFVMDGKSADTDLHNGEGGDGEEVVLEFTPKKREQTAGGADQAWLKQLELAGISVQDGIRYSADKPDLYRELLKDYLNGVEKKRAQLAEDFTARDWSAYHILVHALKSSSRTIGAMETAELAKDLEHAAVIGDGDFIIAHHEEFMIRYEKTAEDIRKAIGGA
ncbi:MAG: response regulator [Lachnospiraceae bacterium]|nr:response regulator [Lachnospiraceae bacterium]